MIKSDTGKMTAKQVAKEAISDALERAFYWQEQLHVDNTALTEREERLIHEQVSKLVSRIYRDLDL